MAVLAPNHHYVLLDKMQRVVDELGGPFMFVEKFEPLYLSVSAGGG